MWKQRTSSKATYSKLMKIFERAGYQNCADKVAQFASILSNTESEDSSSSGEEQTQQEQPPTYPSSQQQQVLTHQPVTPKSTKTYVIVDENNLPKGKINASTYTYKVMSYIKLLCLY